ncbi:hypothetical protein SUGI_0116700 [Cryptomeria japonica]|nr:hypothetical protein SUGI_0116700 [Cryptomeria japonica]
MAATSSVLLQLVLAATAIILLDKIGAVSSNTADLQREWWRSKLPEVGIPETLAVRLSPLSSTQVQNFATGLKNMDATYAGQFCKFAGLLCREDVPHILRRGSSHGKSEGTLEEEKEHVFFDKEELRESGQIILPDLNFPQYLKSFLPKDLAEMMPPFSSANVSQILNLLDIPRESNMSRSMVDTLRICEEREDEGEVKSCSTSIEGMVEFVVSLLGSDVELLSDPSVVGSGQRVTVTMAAKRENIVGGKPPVTCHNFVFPYGMTYCHSFNGSEVFDLQLEVVQDDEKVVRNATAICHYFSDGVRGNWASCHLVYGDMLVWLPKPKQPVAIQSIKKQTLKKSLQEKV